MKTLLLLITTLLSGCAGYETTFSVGYENEEGKRLDASATFRPTGKQTVRTSSK